MALAPTNALMRDLQTLLLSACTPTSPPANGQLAQRVRPQPANCLNYKQGEKHALLQRYDNNEPLLSSNQPLLQAQPAADYCRLKAAHVLASANKG